MDEINNNRMDKDENMNGGEVAAIPRYSTIFIVIGWISAVISLMAFPFVFGIVGVIMGVLATKNGSKAGLPLIAASIVFMGIGLIYSNVIMNYIRHYTGL